MATHLKIRSAAIESPGDPFGGGVAGAFALHAAVVGVVVGWAWIVHSGKNWGDVHSTAGAVQATMVDALPLPPKAPMNPDNVLATEAPSPAPITATQKTVEAVRPDAVAIPTVTAKPAKVADKTTPTPPAHPQPTKAEPDKAQTGDASGVRIPMSSTQTSAGTVSVTTPDASFGARFAYYVQQITQKVASQWDQSMLDPQATGHRVYITFQVERVGSLTHIQIARRSGDATLDQTALSAVQHIDTFGPLPDAYTGSHINVTYYFDPPPRP
jgi:protein TonB